MTPTPGGRRLATVTIPAPDLRPETFLRHAQGEPRGLWTRGQRWIAHRGVVAELLGPPGGAEDRFGDVAAAAAAIAVDPVLPPGSMRAPKVRFFGGFSFLDDHTANGAWSAFPTYAFHLPAFGLEGDGSGDAWLRARALVSQEDADDTLARLRRSAEALRAELASLSERMPRTPRRVVARSVEGERAPWESAVQKCLEAIRVGRVSKVVLARTMDVEASIDPVDLVTHLWEMNRGSHVFLFEPTPGAALVGAAPETIATLRDGVFHATAVAGSIRRGANPQEQAELATRLLASEKDRNEQRIVVDDLVARLGAVAHQIRTDPQPHVLTLSRIQHLETEIRASIPSGTSVLDLLRLLHPTPAVCGLPRDSALSVLAEEERFDRGWYAGPVGWFDAEGNGIFAPALRTAVRTGDVWRLFAGAGIVEGSVPALEWDETGMKFTSVLEALRAAGADFVTQRAERVGATDPGRAG